VVLTSIRQKVEASRSGACPTSICQMPSGWAVLSDYQFLRGYSLLLPDPVVPDLNALDEKRRSRFLLDMSIIGDALLEVVHGYLINYEILGNAERALHAHVFPRFATEPDEKRSGPVWFYSRQFRESMNFEPERDHELKRELAQSIQRRL
jgi:diadenosine tetraphosphate (Ap4A) HIT family hydrolase